MKADPILATLVDLRNITEKEGSPSPEIDLAAVVRIRSDDMIEAGVVFRGVIVYGHNFSLKECESALVAIARVVEDAGKTGYLQAKAQGRTVAMKLMTLRQDETGTWRDFEPVSPLRKCGRAAIDMGDGPRPVHRSQAYLATHSLE